MRHDSRSAAEGDTVKCETQIWLNTCQIGGCHATTVSANLYKDGEPTSGLRLLGSCKLTRAARRLQAEDVRYAKAVGKLKTLAEGGPHADDARKLLETLDG